VVAEVLVSSAVPVIRSRARRQHHLASRCPAELRSEGRRNHSELLQGFHRNEAARTAKCTECLRGSGSRLSCGEGGSNAEVGGHAIDGEIARIRSLSPNAELPGRQCAARRRNHNTRRKLKQRVEAPPVQG